MTFNLLRFLAVACAVANLVAEATGHRGTVYVTKPLTTLLLVLVALVASPPLDGGYRVLIAIGLAFSLAGDVFLMLPNDLFVPGLASFLVAHLCYTAAFFRARGGGIALKHALPFGAFGLIMLVFLWPGLAMLKLPVVCYVVVIQAMAWQAFATWAATRRPGALLAAAGACAFLASDSLLAIDRFRGHFPGARVAVMVTYYLAQWLIASSVRR